ncbi:hypothetical protein QE406_002461 [Microbacterium testaceum]|nr:hypothetical protein [Microbacterium sp. SORGH_AS_0969]MDQ1116452.1 hypothetical protein [Microbacterium testaceum]
MDSAPKLTSEQEREIEHIRAAKELKEHLADLGVPEPAQESFLRQMAAEALALAATQRGISTKTR